VLTCCVQTHDILERPHCRPRRQPMVIALAARLYNEQGVSHNAPPQRGSRYESARSATHRALTTPLTQRHARTTEGIPCEHTRMIARRALRGRQGRGSATPARIYARFMWQNECKTQVIAHAGARTPHSRSRPLQQCTCIAAHSAPCGLAWGGESLTRARMSAQFYGQDHEATRSRVTL
jgi:hypothetical protein